MKDNPDRPEGHTTQPARAPANRAPANQAPAGFAPDWVDAQILDARPPLQISTNAAKTTVAWARREFANWLAVDLPAGDLFDDLVLVVYEALANTVDHAYINTAAGTGPVELIARRSNDAIRISVMDHGTWRDAPTIQTFRGRGLPLIRLLVHDVHVEIGPTGTTVHLRTPLPSSASTAS